MKIAVIGAGFGGLSVSALLAKDGHKVDIYEKNIMPGGRAQIYEHEGFVYDMGPSWYLMPDAFEYYFSLFNKKPTDYYKLIKLEPAYRVYFDNTRYMAISSNLENVYQEFEKISKGSSKLLRKHLEKVKEKYELGVPNFLLKSYESITDLLDPIAVKNVFKLEIEQSFHNSISKIFKSKEVQRVLEFMTVFLGGSPYELPALYNLINWADFGLKVYYPDGGFFSVSKGLEKLCLEMGVKIEYNRNVEKIDVVDGVVKGVKVNGKQYDYDIVISNADMHFTQTKLLDSKWQTYKEGYWKNSDLSPSGVCIFLGLDKKIEGITHHTLVFSDGWEEHFKSIKQGYIPQSPQYYVSTPSVTDSSVAPDGKENLFILIPTSPYLEDTLEQREKLFNFVISDLEAKLKTDIRGSIIHKRIMGKTDFESMYNSYMGNAFGLAHTLKHSLFLRPKNRLKKVKNLYYVGQYTNPGTGTPLVLLSGVIVRNMINIEYGS